MRKLVNLLPLIGAILGFVIVLYLVVAFTDFPVLSDMRNLWIETAMTTGEHQWLATRFFPKSVIDKVMSNQVKQTDILNDPNLIKIPKSKEVSPKVEEFEDIDIIPVITPEPEIIEIPRVSQEGELDEFGNTIIVDDLEQDIRIVEVKGNSYVGHLMFISDPSRVVVTTTNKRDVNGQVIAEQCSSVNGIAAINGNGFADAEGKGSGGSITGWTVSNGEAWGSGRKEFLTSMGFDRDNRLIVGNLKDFEGLYIRDLVQFQPALIIDGKQLVEGSAGWGLQPRTAVGQMEDGTVVLAVIDGRQAGYSLGITVGDLATLLKSYGVVNAGLCDGGSSSVMYYNESIIGIPSTPSKATGRRLPNAVVVLRK